MYINPRINLYNYHFIMNIVVIDVLIIFYFIMFAKYTSNYTYLA